MARKRGDKSGRDSKSTRRQQEKQEAKPEEPAPTDEEFRAALAERDKRITELEAQVAEASKTVGSAETLARDRQPGGRGVILW